MPLERFPADDPREWLIRARSNLVLAKADLPGVLLEDLCFEAQQAAEKAIKAVLVADAIDFPYVHDLRRLLMLSAKAGDVFPFAPEEAARLTPLATGSRHPNDDWTVTRDDYRQAVTIAEAVVAWAEERIAKGQGDAAP